MRDNQNSKKIISSILHDSNQEGWAALVGLLLAHEVCLVIEPELCETFFLLADLWCFNRVDHGDATFDTCHNFAKSLLEEEVVRRYGAAQGKRLSL
jgi:hypothetical protein